MMLAELPLNLSTQGKQTTASIQAILKRVEPEEKYLQYLYLYPIYRLTLKTGKVIDQMDKFLYY